MSRPASTETVERTKRPWQRRAQRELSPEDLREITENVTGFFRLLDSWQRGSRAAESACEGAQGQAVDRRHG